MYHLPKEKRTQAYSHLFQKNYEQGANVGDIETLVSVAVALGEDATAIRNYLLSHDDYDTILQLSHEASRRGIHGVPHFILSGRGKLELSGACSPQDFVEALETVF